MITIIIDRVGNTNIFNIIHDQSSENLLLRDNQSLSSITDDDLIDEFLTELHNIAAVSRTFTRIKGGEVETPYNSVNFDISKRIHQIGEAFYRQFFPKVLIDFLKNSNNEYLYFHVDYKLASIPLELLSDGYKFLWEKFFIGKSVKGQQNSTIDFEAKEYLQMLIIADPTEDLDWARKEGEYLYDHLSTNFPEKKLQIEMLSGRRITKLSLLNAIVGKDLIHYSGHLHYTDDLQENGWILYNNKIVHAREVQLSGAKPILIFSNSCISGSDREQMESGQSWYENFASSFLKSGKTNYIGTIWELPDTKQTLNFTQQFYNSLFDGESVGYALFKARDFSRRNFSDMDLTWASYLLMGSPLSQIFRPDARTPDLSQNVLNYDLVAEKYPYPIALAYDKFINLVLNKEKHANSERIEALFRVLDNTILFLTALIFANYNNLNLSDPIELNAEDPGENLANIYKVLKIVKTLKTETVIPNLLETMYVHKDDIYKLYDWKKMFLNNLINEDNIEGYSISLQYLLERFLMELEYLKNYGFYRIMDPGYIHLSIYGLPRYHKMREITLPTQASVEIREELTVRTAPLTGKSVFYIPVKRLFLDLSLYFDLGVTLSESGDYQYAMHFLSYGQTTEKKSKVLNSQKTRTLPVDPIHN